MRRNVSEARETLYAVAERALRDREISAYVEGVKRAKSDVSQMQLATTAVCLENTRRWLRKMQETSDSSAVGNFINYGFELITAVLPNLVANEVVSVQPMSRKTGEIFFMKYLYGSDKGNVAEGTDMFGVYQSGNAGYTHYTSTIVYLETVATGNGVDDVFNTYVAKIPAVAIAATAEGAISISDGVETFTDPLANGTLVGSAGGHGTFNYSTGALHLDFAVAPLNLAAIRATYTCNFEANPDNIPELDFVVWSETVTAKARKIRTKYSLDAMWDLQEAFGRAVDGDVVSACAADVRAETDSEILTDLYDGAYDTVTTWDRNMPMGVSWRDHKYGILDVMTVAKNMIFNQTRRAEGNFLVAGIEVCNVIESLETRFRRTQDVPLSGPYIVGYIDEMPVIKNPYYGAKEYLVGHRGNVWLDVGYVYAPYMPLFVTPPVTLDDQIVRRGLGTRYGKKMVNNRMYVSGAITGSDVPTPAP